NACASPVCCAAALAVASANDSATMYRPSIAMLVFRSSARPRDPPTIARTPFAPTALVERQDLPRPSRQTLRRLRLHARRPVDRRGCAAWDVRALHRAPRRGRVVARITVPGRAVVNDDRARRPAREL